MALGSRLVCGAALMLALTLGVRAATHQQTDVGRNFSSASQDGGAKAPPYELEYLGSASCGRCHSPEYKAWQNSLHIKMTKPISEAEIVGDFRDGTKFADHDRSYAFGSTNGKPFITVTYGSAKPETFSVDYTLGAKRYQGYLSTLPDGRIYVLPVFWHIDSNRWIDWKELTPIPDGAHDIRQIWNVNCFNCHATNIAQGFDVATRKYQSTWTEMGIGCEACHGPGRDHVALMETWEKNPALKPAYDKSATNRELSGLLKTFSTRGSEPRKVFDTCAYCHGNKLNVFVGFKAGDRYEDFALPFLISQPIPANDFQGEFWPDGRPNRFNRPQALAQSGCFKAGAISCASCHDAHGSPNEYSLKVNIHQGRDGDTLCTQCHSDSKADGRRPKAALAGASLSQHTFHAPESEGSRCINCHMSDLNWRLLIRRRDHTFDAPVPENTTRFGIPNACTTCHDDKSPEWAAAQMTKWWGDGDRRARSVTLADTMYRAGSGDITTLPALARLAVDRSQGSIVRASAADYIGRLSSPDARRASEGAASMQSQTSFAKPGSPASTRAANRATGTPAELTPAIVNALIGAADDPEPVVRASAVTALGTIGDRERALAPVLARLVDTARVVRARAAAVLVSFGVVQLPGAAGEALRKAQADYVLSLDSFPEIAVNHASKGWLEAERGNATEAVAALDKAIAVEPVYAFPWVVKGMLAARQGRFAEARDLWRKARTIEPSYPNIDQLIAEAEKRK